MSHHNPELGHLEIPGVDPWGAVCPLNRCGLLNFGWDGRSRQGGFFVRREIRENRTCEDILKSSLLTFQ